MVNQKISLQPDCMKDFKAGMNVTRVSKKWKVSRVTLNKWGITKKAQVPIIEALINEGRLEGKTAETMSEELHIKVAKVRKRFKEAVKAEAEYLKQIVEDTSTSRVLPPKAVKTTKEGKLIKGVIELRKAGMTLAEKKASYPGIFDLWSYVTGKMQKRYLLTTEEGLFARATLNIPFVNYQPAKRIHLAAKSLFNWIETPKNSGHFISESNFVKLEKPDPCLIEGLKHDVDTLNVTVGLPQDNYDYETCKEDACIISAELAKRFHFTFIKNIFFVVDESRVLQPKFEVMPGDTLGKDAEGNDNIIVFNGILSVLKEKTIKGSEEKVVSASVRIERDAIEGDKITGLTGLKVVIGEIRTDLTTDIIISDNQIWNSTKPDGQRGAMVKELLSTGKIMVGLRKDTLVENQATRNKGASMSSTLYPLMMLEDIDVTKQIINDNSSFNELLKTLHLQYHSEGYTFLSETIIDLDEENEHSKPEWVKYPHYCYTGKEFENHFGSRIPEDPLTMKVIDFKDKKVLPASADIDKSKHRYLVWDYCYNPSFLPPAFLSENNDLRESALFVKLKEGFDNTLGDRLKLFRKAIFPHSVVPFATKEEEAKHIIKKSAIHYQIKEQLFCTVRNGYYLVAIPQIGMSENVIEMNNTAGFGSENGYALVVREPVVEKANIACVKIGHNPKLPLGVVKIAPSLIKAMSGDFDGDRVAILPYYSATFRVQPQDKNSLTLGDIVKPQRIKTLSKIYNTSLTEFLATLTPMERTDKQLTEEAFEFMQGLYEDLRYVSEFGGLRKKASFRNPEVKQQDIIDSATRITELLLKPELKLGTPGWKDLLKKEEIKLRDMTPEYSGKGDMWYLMPSKGSKFDTPTAYRRLLGFKPPRFWAPLFQFDIAPPIKMRVSDTAKGSEQQARRSSASELRSFGNNNIKEENE